LYRRDPVFILGQSLGLFIYLRNLQLVLRERASMAERLRSPRTAPKN
jgi:lipid-A-disaccharide synthase-like uncharacterized protein